MQTIRGNIDGPLNISADTTLRANVMGDVIVRPGRRLIFRGNVMGDIILERGAIAEMRGNLTGEILRADLSRATATKAAEVSPGGFSLLAARIAPGLRPLYAASLRRT